ncbi:MAG: DNA polymerase IV [Candidatus Omnitrophica bacterium]|nr:DNA polymerase IV [Candidatus Omnitrophota bacterium]
MPGERYIIHIDMDAFFASVEELDNPSYRGKPVIVGSDPKGGKGRGVVAACSYAARKFGIHSAMPISKAYQKCPDGIYVQPRMERYCEISDRIFSLLEKFTPDIEPLSIDEAFLDISGSYQHFGTPETVCKLIKELIKKDIGLNSSIGMAPNMMTAKIASDTSKPDGLIIVKKEDNLKFLWPLPIGKLWGAGEKTCEALKNIGILTIGDLAKTNKEKLVSLFGRNGGHMWELSHGIDERVVERESEAKSISNEHTFDTDTGDVDTIMNTVMFLSGKVSRRLRKHGFKARTITLKIRFSDFKTFTRSETIEPPTNFINDLYSVCAGKLKEFGLGKRKVRLIGVGTSNFEENSWSSDLFGGKSSKEQKNEKLHNALDRIKDKFGESAIGFRA